MYTGQTGEPARAGHISPKHPRVLRLGHLRKIRPPEPMLSSPAPHSPSQEGDGTVSRLFSARYTHLLCAPISQHSGRASPKARGRKKIPSFFLSFAISTEGWRPLVGDSILLRICGHFSYCQRTPANSLEPDDSLTAWHLLGFDPLPGCLSLPRTLRSRAMLACQCSVLEQSSHTE
ncbi:hypothetical protein MRX96_002850 [Rhipicephalus microplus]